MSGASSFDDELEQAVLNLGIPSCPKILLSLAEEAEKEEPDLLKIEKLICADVGLSAALIKTVNSPFYGLRSKVHSVMQAIHMLGLSHLSLMVTGMALRDVLIGSNHVDMERFWDSSTKIAIISSYIAGRLPYMGNEKSHRPIVRDEAYTYGLFQDCGISIMLNCHPGYKDTLRLANETADKMFTEVEDLEYVNNHTAIGAVLARSWGLPDHMVQAIRNHHEHRQLEQNPDFLPPESRDFIALALVSERAIQLVSDLYHTCEWQKGSRWAMEHFGWSEDDFNSVIQGIRTLSDEGNLNF